MENFHSFASILIFFPWALLIFFPRWKYTEICAFATAFLLLLAGAFFTWKFLRTGAVEGSLLSLDGLTSLFRNNDMLLTGWFNYLSFSLFTGVWQSADSREEKIPHAFVAPCLLGTLLAGPTGLLMYLMIRWVKTRKWQVR